MIKVVLRNTAGDGYWTHVVVDADLVTFIEASGFIEMLKNKEVLASFNSKDVVYYEEVSE